MNKDQGKHTYFENLDALRFISFLGVFVMHTISAPASGNTFLNFGIQLISLGYFAVPFFFTLSSFLITYNLLVRKNAKGGISLAGFYRNRILRIWPVYFILVATCFILFPLASTYLGVKPASLPHLLPFLFFYVNFYIINNGMAFTSALVILWSISIEEQFYLLWGPLMKFIKVKWIIPAITLLFAGSIIFSLDYLYVQHQPASNLTIHSIFVLQNFCTGALMAILCVNKGTVFYFFCNRSKLFWLSVYVILPVSGFFIEEVIAVNLVKSICYSLIIFDQAFNAHRLFNAGKLKLVNYLGKISYGLYMYHALVIVVLQNRFQFTNSPVLQNLLQAVLFFAITCLVAHISYRYIESKLLRLKSSPWLPLVK